VQTTEVPESVMVEANLLRASTVPDRSCRNVLLITVAAVVIISFS